MSAGISGEGTWQLCLDPEPCQYETPPDAYPLMMQLPGTTAQQAIGAYNSARATGYLTEKYPFSGQIWLRRTFVLLPGQIGMPCFLHLERTRMTKVWVNGEYVGSENSLCTPHIYDLTAYSEQTMEIVICVRNIGYPTRGGHMTSPDTQTNWIGITGKVMLEIHSPVYLSDLQVYPEPSSGTALVTGILHGSSSSEAEIVLTEDGWGKRHVSWKLTLHADADGNFSITLPLPDEIPLWDEYHPNLFGLVFTLKSGAHACVQFGVRTFRAAGDHFEINGVPVMLRGKHDAMVFPLDGAAPTDAEDWLMIFQQMKEWGINHYRFHTCCPPEAAFTAADEAGIYMEPELPFWGTVHAPDEPGYNAEEQAYLLREGLRICKAFGNHPSFCMFSLGNELWGSEKRLGEMIETLRKADARMLYTQGSNNYQHMPIQLPEEDFWTGVRTGKGRLLRGSYAECDAPLGRIQSGQPSASWDYEAYLTPLPEGAEPETEEPEPETELDVQVGIETAHAAVKKPHKILHPTIPVVTHEIGQYSMFPDFREIARYNGVLAAGNLEIFQEKLEQAGMGEQAEEFFACSGAFARECYKMELEAAMRSPHVAGFQILDLQDFPGQGTALVGMMNALLENKGLVLPEQWRGFGGDLVPLAIFDTYVMPAGKTFRIKLAIRSSRPEIPAQKLAITLLIGTVRFEGEIEVPRSAPGLIRLGTVAFAMPEGLDGRAVLTLSLPHEKIQNAWELWFLPPVRPVLENPDIHIVHSFTDAEPYLREGERVLLLPYEITEAVEGFYCTDFWNYPMFRSISESLGKKEPVGTLGLCIDETHPIAQAMFSRYYSTPQWYQPVTNAQCAVLDAAPAGYRPIVQMIDNASRNHRLGLIFETAVSGGKLLVCTIRLGALPNDLGMNLIRHAVYEYVQSTAFEPEEQLPAEMLRGLFG